MCVELFFSPYIYRAMDVADTNTYKQFSNKIAKFVFKIKYKKWNKFQFNVGKFLELSSYAYGGWYGGGSTRKKCG